MSEETEGTGTDNVDQAPKVGIKETKELLTALGYVARLIIEKGRDGYSLKDALDIGLSLLRDLKFRDAIVEAVKGSMSIPGELGNLETAEVIELSELLIREICEGVAAASADRAKIEAKRELIAAKEMPGSSHESNKKRSLAIDAAMKKVKAAAHR